MGIIMTVPRLKRCAWRTVNLDKLSDGLPEWLGEMKLAFWRKLEFKMLNPARLACAKRLKWEVKKFDLGCLAQYIGFRHTVLAVV
jgi:hypothetical protein